MNYKCRIILFDGDKHDRALLGLALRSALPNAEVLDASSAVDVAHHVSAGAVDAVIADPVARFGETIALVLDIRRRHPACQCWLFSSEGSLPALRDCVGRGIDGRIAKTSSGFLELPEALSERLRWSRELHDRLPLDATTLFSSVFPGATCLLGDDDHLLMVSEEFERIVEQPRFELTGQSFAQFWLDGDKREEWRARMARPPRSWDFVGRFRCPRADKPVMAITLKMLGSEPAGRRIWAATLTDVTSLAAATRAPQERDAAFEADHLVFALTHDLQAPLNSLASHAATLEQSVDNQPDDVAAVVREIGGLTRRMQQMLDGIAHYASSDAQTEPREIVSLDGVLEDAIANLRSMIDESGATIERQPLPALAVVKSRMTQVFQNLISNAIKFSGNRIPRIRVSAEETSDYLRIRFEDNGIGIDFGEQERIFNMFYRLHSEAEYPGIGAGLAICRRIVRAHGGEIRVESNPGRGSCFILEFRGAAVRRLNSGNNASESVG